VVAPETCQQSGSIAAYNLNLPSLTAGSMMGRLTMTRTVTNVSATTSTYHATASLPGFSVAVSPSSLTLAPGAKATFTVGLTRTTALDDEYSFGVLEWRDGTHVVRSPLTVRPTPFVAPQLLYSEKASGNRVFTIGSTVDGKLSAHKGGLKPATLEEATVGQILGADFGVQECLDGGSTGVNATSVTIPANTMAARFSLRDIDTSGFRAGRYDDLDLLMFNPAGEMVGLSIGSTSNEAINLMAPAAGTYRLCVAGFRPDDGSATYTMASWVVGSSDVGGNLKVSLPSNVAAGGTASVVASWSGLAANQRYMGAMQYMSGVTPLATTMLEVDTTNPVPLRSPTAKAALTNSKATAPADKR
jgi:hypothetical protein